MNIKQNTDLFAQLPKPVLESSKRWVRVEFGDEIVADSKRPRLLLQYGPGALPAYFFPQESVRMDLLGEAQDRDDKRYWTLRVGDKQVTRSAWAYLRPPEGMAELQGHITFVWHKMDAWYEEEEEIFAHPRDPHKRVDAIPSSRHVKVVINGEVVAETRRPTLLFETWLPTRYYLPKEDVRLEYLQPSTTTTRCPYKGKAEYWTATVGGDALQDIAWSYPEPIPENPKIKGLICFFNEKVDLYVDGVLQSRPITPWAE